MSANEKKYWKSLKDKENDPSVIDYKHNEFTKEAIEKFDVEGLSPLSRRRFLALLSASSAFAVAACSDYRDRGEIISYNKKPEEIIYGQPNYYASTCTGCSNACGILVKTQEGRPIKIDGNPEHPVNQGKICSIGQSSILNLYSPERIQTSLKKSGGSFTEIAWLDADKEILSALNAARGSNREIALVAHKIVSPSTAKALKDFVNKYPSAKIYSYEQHNDQNRNEGWRLTHGAGTYPLIKWDEAKVILSIESDFLSTEGHEIENIRKFVKKRDITNIKDFNRFYAAESRLSPTGMNVDYRFAIRPEAQYDFVMSILSELINNRGMLGVSLNQDFINGLSQYSLERLAQEHKLSIEKLRLLISDLANNRGASIVYAGDILPVNIHAAVNILNEVLDNSRLYITDTAEIEHIPFAKREEFDALVYNMKSKKVDVVIHFDSNPVYHLPKDYGYAEALKNVPHIVSLTEFQNESSALGVYTLPVNHFLESWGDYQTRAGVISLQQPVIEPLYKTRQKEAILLNWISGNVNQYSHDIYHKYIMNRWETEVYMNKNLAVDFKTFWFASLHDGVFRYGEVQAAIGGFNSASAVPEKKNYDKNKFALLLTKSAIVGDGRYANNGWQQELPHPVSKVVWDNYAAISPSSAKKLNVKNNDLIDITVSGRKLSIPVVLQPGMAENVVSIDLGYGRWEAGEIGTEVGFYANELMTKNPDFSNWIYINASVTKGDGSYEIVSTQEHHSLDDEFVKDLHYERGIIQEGSVLQYLRNPDFLEKHAEEPLSIVPGVEYQGVKWGMAIDLNKCLGCNQCTASCNVENNIPVVGKEQVGNGREMHWLRIDRYYSGTSEEPTVSSQPMLCQHCDNAPCENVCPVVATSHSADGLNQMVYNRCVGTRYCSNNCPYKVRRFNFLDYRGDFAGGIYEQDSVKLVHNPEVTVRSRGVMEKCTFCVQRISEGRREAAEAGKAFDGAGVTTACQDACPADAIVFGNLNDKNSRVSKLHKHNLSYSVLEETNARPNIAYMAKLRNIQSEEV